MTDVWTALANMPDGGRNHAASGTDGVKLYVFGGRRGGNFVTNGYDSVMVYDPVADTWDWSGAAGSTLAPLPEARGGMGKAIYFRGEFYIFGGETLDDPDANANGVYDRVDVYRPLANTWRLEAPMPNPRHGIHPVLFQGHMFLPAGGTQSANSQSNLFDAFTRQ
jgi:N-acetylneuraminic acid mutarotase